MEITNDIQALIREKMPAAVGEELRQVLEQAKKDANAVGQQRALIAKRDEELTNARKEIDRLQAIVDKHAALDAREANVDARERSALVRDLTVDLAAEKRVASFAMDLMTKLVRNTEYRQGVLGQVPLAVAGAPPSQYNPSGSPGYVLPGQVDTKTTGEAL